MEIIKENQHDKLMKELCPYNVSSNAIIKTFLLWDYKQTFFFLLIVLGLEIVEKGILGDRSCANGIS